MFPPGSPLPVSLRDWTRTHTNCKSCTIRGVDWEVVNARNLCKLHGVQVSELTTEETLKRVLQFPDLVRTNDWVQLEMASGIRTNSYALESMMTRCTNAALEYPHLEACGLGSLKATLRSTAPEAPRSALQPAALVSNLETPCPCILSSNYRSSVLSYWYDTSIGHASGPSGVSRQLRRHGVSSTTQ